MQLQAAIWICEFRKYCLLNINFHFIGIWSSVFIFFDPLWVPPRLQQWTRLPVLLFNPHLRFCRQGHGKLRLMPLLHCSAHLDLHHVEVEVCMDKNLVIWDMQVQCESITSSTNFCNFTEAPNRFNIAPGPLCATCDNSWVFDPLSRQCVNCNWGVILSGLVLLLPIGFVLPTLICCCFGRRRTDGDILQSAFSDSHIGKKKGRNIQGRKWVICILSTYCRVYLYSQPWTPPTPLILHASFGEHCVTKKITTRIFSRDWERWKFYCHLCRYICRELPIACTFLLAQFSCPINLWLIIIVIIAQILSSLASSLQFSFPTRAAAVLRIFSLFSLQSILTVPLQCLESSNNFFTVFEFATGVPILAVLSAAVLFFAKREMFVYRYSLAGELGRALLARCTLFAFSVTYVSFAGISSLVRLWSHAFCCCCTGYFFV